MVCLLPLSPTQVRGFIDEFTYVFHGNDSRPIRVIAGRNTPLSADNVLGDFDEEEPTGD